MTHVEKAQNLFQQRYHCSQAVLAAFAEELGLTQKQALKLGGCFGGGMCKGEVCGACTGALMALGLKYGQCKIDDLESRAKTNEIAVENHLFTEVCPQMVVSAVKIAERFLKE